MLGVVTFLLTALRFAAVVAFTVAVVAAHAMRPPAASACLYLRGDHVSHLYLPNSASAHHLLDTA
jgi:hypothetical protein